VISITCASSDTVVTIDGFTIRYGNATGLGGPEIVTGPDASELPGGALPREEREGGLSMQELSVSLRERMAGMAERGVYPGGSGAYRAMQSKLGWIDSLVEKAQTSAENQPGVKRTDQAADYGGGIYSFNASLHLLNNMVWFNVASQENEAYGGGIFVGETAPGGVVLRDNVVQYNTASMYDVGGGGGLYLLHAPGTIVEGNQFLENGSTGAGMVGVGGGMYVDKSLGALLHQKNAGAQHGAR
jgi:hypothetical protein